MPYDPLQLASRADAEPPVLAYRPPADDFRPLTASRLLAGLFFSGLLLACLLLGTVCAGLIVSMLTTGRVGSGPPPASGSVVWLPVLIVSAVICFFCCVMLFVAARDELSPRRKRPTP